MYLALKITLQKRGSCNFLKILLRLNNIKDKEKICSYSFCYTLIVIKITGNVQQYTYIYKALYITNISLKFQQTHETHTLFYKHIKRRNYRISCIISINLINIQKYETRV
jgi:hypothetical protein